MVILRSCELSAEYEILCNPRVPGPVKNTGVDVCHVYQIRYQNRA